MTYSSLNNRDVLTFVHAVIDYNSYQNGGARKKKFISVPSITSSDFKIRKNNLSKYTDSDDDDEYAMARSESNTAYNNLLTKIIDLFKITEERAKYFRTYLKRKILDKNPDLKGRRNDDKRIEMINDMLEDKKEIKKLFKDFESHEDEYREKAMEIQSEREQKKKQLSVKKSKKLVNENGYFTDSSDLISDTDSDY